MTLIGKNSITDMNLANADTVEQLISYATKALACHSDSAKLDSQILLSFTLEKPISYLYAWPDAKLNQPQRQAFESLLMRRMHGEPVAYLVGEKEFWSLTLAVSPATLIPRPDTETLIELVLENHPSNHLRCLDLGTGTGAIALALASEKPHWQIDAVDFNCDAVALAKQNAINNQLTQVSIYQSDWFSDITHDKVFDVIVSNPPYIADDDKHLAEGDVRFEPLSALVAKNNGLADIEHIIRTAKSYLTANGFLYLEHGFEQGQAVRSLLIAHGYNNAQTVCDLNGQERISFACIALP